MRIRDLDREALEKLLVNSVEEVLLLGVFGDGVGGRLDGRIEAVKVSQELVAAESTARSGL